MFSLNSINSSSPMQFGFDLLDRRRALEERFDHRCDEAGFPQEWPPLRRELALLYLFSEQPNVTLMEDLAQSYDRVEHGMRGYAKASPYVLDQLETELGCIEPQLKAFKNQTDQEKWEGAVAFASRLARGEGLRGGCTRLASLDWRYIFIDAFLIAVVNGMGYLAGSFIQSTVERHFCENNELHFIERVVAELLNRTTQHLLRFALRDVAIPAFKSSYSLKWYNGPKGAKAWLNLALAAGILTAMDQTGVALLGLFPPGKTEGDRRVPDLVDSSVPMLSIAGTDFVAWTLIGISSQLLFGTRYEMVEKPFKSLGSKLIIHAIQIAADSVILSGWKHSQQGMNPNSLCRPGVNAGSPGDPLPSPNLHLFVLLLDAVELTTIAGVTGVVQLLDRRHPREGEIEPSAMNTFQYSVVNNDSRWSSSADVARIMNFPLEELFSMNDEDVDHNVDVDEGVFFEEAQEQDPLPFRQTEVEAKLRQMQYNSASRLFTSSNPRPEGQG